MGEEDAKKAEGDETKVEEENVEGKEKEKEDEEKQPVRKVLDGIGRMIILRYKSHIDSGLDEKYCYILEGQFKNDKLVGFGRILTFVGGELKQQIGFFN